MWGHKGSALVVWRMEKGEMWEDHILTVLWRRKVSTRMGVEVQPLRCSANRTLTTRSPLLWQTVIPSHLFQSGWWPMSSQAPPALSSYLSFPAARSACGFLCCCMPLIWQNFSSVSKTRSPPGFFSPRCISKQSDHSIKPEKVLRLDLSWCFFWWWRFVFS